MTSQRVRFGSGGGIEASGCPETVHSVSKVSKYRTIVVDPPWPYPEGFATGGGPNHDIRLPDGTTRRRTREEQAPIARAALPYPSMSIAELAALPVSKFADRDARVLLWTTNRHLGSAFTLLESWGFKYRQCLVWDKTPNIPPYGGSVARNAAEYILVGQRGAPGRRQVWPTSIVRARRARTTHSRKPDVFLDIAEAVSPGPYLELFARRQRLGWDTWGDEAFGHVDLGGQSEDTDPSQSLPGSQSA